MSLNTTKRESRIKQRCEVSFSQEGSWTASLYYNAFPLIHQPSANNMKAFKVFFKA